MVNQPKKAFSTRKIWRFISWIVIAAVFVAWMYAADSATHQLSPVKLPLHQPTLSDINFSWPSRGAAAIGTIEEGLIAQYGTKEPLPTASMAKAITVLVVLDKYPLTLDAPGPTLTMGKIDVELYDKTLLAGGSNLPVFAGQQLTLRTVIDGMMLESANNLADSLAIWAFGSLSEYKKAATSWIANHNLSETTIGPDASGLDPATTSSTGDLLKIAQLVMKNDTLSHIVAQATASFSTIRKITNTNILLNNGFKGIKTGYTSAAGYCLLFASDYTREHQTKIIIGAMLGQESSASRFKAASMLVESANNNLDYATAIKKGDVVAYYDVPWASNTEVVAAKDVGVLRWKNKAVDSTLNLPPIVAPKKAGDSVGSINLNGQVVDIVLKSDIPAPSLVWKLTHPFSTGQ